MHRVCWFAGFIGNFLGLLLWLWAVVLFARNDHPELEDYWIAIGIFGWVVFLLVLHAAFNDVFAEFWVIISPKLRTVHQTLLRFTSGEVIQIYKPQDDAQGNAMLQCIVWFGGRVGMVLSFLLKALLVITMFVPFLILSIWTKDDEKSKLYGFKRWCRYEVLDGSVVLLILFILGIIPIALAPGRTGLWVGCLDARFLSWARTAQVHRQLRGECAGQVILALLHVLPGLLTPWLMVPLANRLDIKGLSDIVQSTAQEPAYKGLLEMEFEVGGEVSADAEVSRPVLVCMRRRHCPWCIVASVLAVTVVSRARRLPTTMT